MRKECFFLVTSLTAGLLFLPDARATVMSRGKQIEIKFVDELPTNSGPKMFVVQAKLSPDALKLIHFQVDTPKGSVRISKSVYQDVSNPDLRTLMLLYSGNADGIWLSIRFGPERPDLPAEHLSRGRNGDTRATFSVFIKKGRVVTRHFETSEGWVEFTDYD